MRKQFIFLIEGKCGTVVIKIGETLILEPIDEKNSDQYKCRLVEVIGNDMYIDYPIHLTTKKTVFLLNGTQLKISFVANEGNVYLFHSEIIGRVKQNNVPMLKLFLPANDQMIKIQRREYVRVDTNVDVAVHSLQGEFHSFTSMTTDISAGGAAILVPVQSPLKEDYIINSYFVLPLQNGEYTYVKLKAIVKRILDYNELYNKAPIEFLDVNPPDRQVLMRFCFDKQLSFKKKGLES